MMHFSKKLLIVLTTALTFNAWSSVSIISDLDDTIKITNSGSILESIGYGATRRKVYLGMPEFLNEAQIQYASSLTVITASPRVLKYNVKRLLKKHEIEADVVLNRNISRPSKFDFKVEAIKKVMDNTSDSFILMGDDVGEDPEIYDEIMKLYPSRVLASYIHIVKDRKMPESMIKYHTTFDLAILENISGRMSSEAVRRIHQVMMNEKDLESVFPEFVVCPKESEAYKWQKQTEFAAESSKLTSRLVEYCQNEWEED